MFSAEGEKKKRIWCCTFKNLLGNVKGSALASLSELIFFFYLTDNTSETRSANGRNFIFQAL